MNTVSPISNTSAEEVVCDKSLNVKEESHIDVSLPEKAFPSQVAVPVKTMIMPAIASEFITPPAYSRDVTTVALVTPDNEQLTAPIRGAPVHRRVVTKSRSNILRECAIVTPDQSGSSPSTCSRPASRTAPFTKTNLSNLAPSPISRSFSRDFVEGSAAAAPGVTGSNYEIFVGDLSFFCKEMDLYELFCPFGQVLKPRIRRSDKDGRTLMYGFVEMPILEDAEKAVKALHGSRFQGRDIRVEISKCKAERVELQHQQPKPRSKAADFQVHVMFTSQFPHNQIVRPREELLRSIFEDYGKVKDIALKEYVMNKDSNTQEGFFFVSFSDYEEARSVVELVDRATIQGFNFHCSLSYNNNGGEENPHRPDSSQTPTFINSNNSSGKGSINSATNSATNINRSAQSTPKSRGNQGGSNFVTNSDASALPSRGISRENSNHSERGQYKNMASVSNDSQHSHNNSRTPSHPKASAVVTTSQKPVSDSPARSMNNSSNHTTNVPTTFPSMSLSSISYVPVQSSVHTVQPSIATASATVGMHHPGGSNAAVSTGYSHVHPVIQAPVMYVPVPYGAAYPSMHPQSHPPLQHTVPHSSVPSSIQSNTSSHATVPSATHGYYYVPHQQPPGVGYSIPMAHSIPMHMPVPPPAANQDPTSAASVSSNMHGQQFHSSHQVNYPFAPPPQAYQSSEYSRVSSQTLSNSNPVSVQQAPSSHLTYYVPTNQPIASQTMHSSYHPAAIPTQSGYMTMYHTQEYPSGNGRSGGESGGDGRRYQR